MDGMASQRRLSEWFHLSELLPAASGIMVQPFERRPNVRLNVLEDEQVHVAWAQATIDRGRERGCGASPDLRLTRASPCEAISSSPSRKPRLHDRRFRADRTSSMRPRIPCDVKRFSAPQHRPGDPRQLVGQGDDRDIAMGPAHQLFRPSAERRVALGHIGQRRARSMDQLFAQIFVAALADAPSAKSATSSAHKNVETTSPPLATDSYESPAL